MSGLVCDVLCDRPGAQGIVYAALGARRRLHWSVFDSMSTLRRSGRVSPWHTTVPTQALRQDARHVTTIVPTGWCRRWQPSVGTVERMGHSEQELLEERRGEGSTASTAQPEKARVAHASGTVRSDAGGAPPEYRQQRRHGGQRWDEGNQQTSVFYPTARGGAPRRARLRIRLWRAGSRR